MGTGDRRKLASTLDEAAENEKPFVSYITDALLARLTNTTDLSKATYLRINESDAKVKVCPLLLLMVPLEGELLMSTLSLPLIPPIDPLLRVFTMRC